MTSCQLFARTVQMMRQNYFWLGGRCGLLPTNRTLAVVLQSKLSAIYSSFKNKYLPLGTFTYNDMRNYTYWSFMEEWFAIWWKHFEMTVGQILNGMSILWNERTAVSDFGYMWQTQDEMSGRNSQWLPQKPVQDKPPGPFSRKSGPVIIKSGTRFENGDRLMGGMVGVAKLMTSRRAFWEFPKSKSARWFLPFGAKESTPVWGCLKWHFSKTRLSSWILIGIELKKLEVKLFSFGPPIMMTFLFFIFSKDMSASLTMGACVSEVIQKRFAT